MLKRLSVLLLASLAILTGAERRSIFPPNVKPVGPYSPGILTGSFLYVSGQGAQKPGSGLVSGTANQTRQCLENVKTIVEAAGLTMDHIVYTQVYLTDMSQYAAMNDAYKAFFPNRKPARAVIGVARMPLETPVEINAVAVRDLSSRKSIDIKGMLPGAPAEPAVEAAGRVYISGVLGRDADYDRVPESARDQVRLAARHFALALRTAKRKPDQLAAVNVLYTDNVPTDLVKDELTNWLTQYQLIKVASLPARANIEITGVVASDLAITEIAGDSAALLKNAPNPSQAVAVNVLINSIDNFAAMNQIYAGFFGEGPPARTTVQPVASPENAVQILLWSEK